MNTPKDTLHDLLRAICNDDIVDAVKLAATLYEQATEEMPPPTRPLCHRQSSKDAVELRSLAAAVEVRHPTAAKSMRAMADRMSGP